MAAVTETNAGLTVALGDRRYSVERPWGDLPEGFVSDVTIDGRGHVFALIRWDGLADTTSPRVIELAHDGHRLAAWGGPDIADGHMFAASGERLLVVDRDAHEVIAFSRDGTRVSGFGQRHVPGAPFNHPTAVAVASNGDVLVADGYAGHSVHRFSSDGRLICSWGELGDGPGQFLTPHAVCELSDGRIVVVDRDNNRLQVFSAAGEFIAVWPGFFKPMDIWADGSDTIYVTDQIPTLTCLAGDGRRIGRCRPVLNGAHGICGDSHGNIYLAEMNPSRLTRLALRA